MAREWGHWKITGLMTSNLTNCIFDTEVREDNSGNLPN